FRSARLVGEEIVVVEFDRVDAPFVHVHLRNVGHARRGLRQPAPVHHVHHGAKITKEGTAVARMMWQSARPEEGRSDVALNVNPMIGERRETVGVRNWRESILHYL